VSSQLERVERIIDASGAAERIEALLPSGIRPRQLRVRTLLIGMTLAMLKGREALLTGVREALLKLATDEQQRLGVINQWPDGPHTLTYRQLEYTHALVQQKLAKPKPDGTPSELLSEVLDALLEASVTVLGEPDSKSYAVDWTDQETWSRPPAKKPASADDPAPAANAHGLARDHDGAQPPRSDRADPDAAWGRRRGEHPGQADESFYGYYLQAITIVKDEHGPQAPELVRRMHLASCAHDPPPALVPALQRMHASGIEVSDLLADSGYSYRLAEHWALPLRRLGAQLIHDLHPC
jgi:hypothetical protein